MTVGWLVVAACSHPSTEAAALRSVPAPCGVSTCHLLQDCYEVPGADRDGCPDRLLEFSPGSAELSPEILTLLSQLLGEIHDVRPVRLGIVGSADPGEPAGLAMRRATSVRDWLAPRVGASLPLEVESASRGPMLYFNPTCAGPVGETSGSSR